MLALGHQCIIGKRYRRYKRLIALAVNTNHTTLLRCDTAHLEIGHRTPHRCDCAALVALAVTLIIGHLYACRTACHRVSIVCQRLVGKNRVIPVKITVLLHDSKDEIIIIHRVARQVLQHNMHIISILSQTYIIDMYALLICKSHIHKLAMVEVAEIVAHGRTGEIPARFVRCAPSKGCL